MLAIEAKEEAGYRNTWHSSFLRNLDWFCCLLWHYYSDGLERSSYLSEMSPEGFSQLPCSWYWQRKTNVDDIFRMLFWGQVGVWGQVAQWRGHWLSAKRALMLPFPPASCVKSTGKLSPLSHALFFCKMGMIIPFV